MMKLKNQSIYTSVLTTAICLCSNAVFAGERTQQTVTLEPSVRMDQTVDAMMTGHVYDDTITNGPRYAENVIENTEVGVTSGGSKLFNFKPHAKTLDPQKGFVLKLIKSGTKNKANFAVEYSTNGSDYTTFNNCTSTTVPADCTITSETSPLDDITDIRLTVSTGSSSNRYLKYAVTYFQGCDSLAGLACDDTLKYDNRITPFSQNAGTENSLFQGDIQLFDVEAGDIVNLELSSTKTFKNPPSLRIKGTKAGVIQELGGRHECSGAGKVISCIMGGSAVPSTVGYTDVHIILASARTSGGATLTITELEHVRFSPQSCD